MNPSQHRGGGRGSDRTGGQHGRSGNREHQREQSTIDTSRIRLKAGKGETLAADLFDSIAEAAARDIANGKKNKQTQIRRFYDEVVMWEEKIRRNPERFGEYLPFLRMINAKAAYARGRDHVDPNFVKLINHCLEQVDSLESLQNFKLFFEAFMGFYKVVGPKG